MGSDNSMVPIGVTMVGAKVGDTDAFFFLFNFTIA